MGWGELAGFEGGGVEDVSQNQTSPDFRFPQLGISVYVSFLFVFVREPLLRGSEQVEQESLPSTPLLDMGPWSIMVAPLLNTAKMGLSKLLVSNERYVQVITVLLLLILE